MTMTKAQKVRAIIAILSISIILMGVVAAASGLSVISAHFANASKNNIQLIISIPSIVVIISTLFAGKIQEYISKNAVAMLGAILFFVGGVAPAFIDNLPLILVMRGVFGIGLGFLQPITSAIVGTMFDGEERNKIMGWQSAAQQVGASFMSLLGGVLANEGWNLTFLVHGLAIFPIILVPLFLPKLKAARKEAVSRGEKPKVKFTKGAFVWTCAEFLFFTLGQLNAAYNSFIIAEKGVGTPADYGISHIFSCITGMVVGVFFARINKKLKNLTFAFAILMLAIGDGIVAFMPSMFVFYISNLFTGLAFGLAIPTMIVGVTKSVDKYSVAMAMGVAMSVKAVGQFITPYIFNALSDFLVEKFGTFGPNQWVFVVASGLLFIAAIGLFAFGIWKRKKMKEQGIEYV